MPSEFVIKRFLRVKTAQWCYLVLKGEKSEETPYKARFFRHFGGFGTHTGSIAICSWHNHDIEFNMRKVMLNCNNLDGLESLVIHEVCHIVAPRHNDTHGPFFEKLYTKYAGDIATSIDTLVYDD